jgi:hypothetical protein
MPSTTSPPSISTQKLAFLNQQARLLQTPLTATQPPEATQLPPKVLDKAIKDTNAKITSHNRTHFSAQAQQHVAEQIETLYWNRVHEERELLLQGQHGNEEGALGAETAIRRDASLLAEDVENVQKALPEQWGGVVLRPDPAEDDEVGDEEQPSDQRGGEEEAGGEGATYERLRAQLLTLTQQRRDAQQRLKRYKHLQDLLRPYEDAQEHIQPNLVTKDGELAREMEKMRSLLVRVGARMGQHEGRTDHQRHVEDQPETVVSFDRRLDVLMSVD